jgi:hypothetical protein
MLRKTVYGTLRVLEKGRNARASSALAFTKNAPFSEDADEYADVDVRERESLMHGIVESRVVSVVVRVGAVARSFCGAQFSFAGGCRRRFPFHLLTNRYCSPQNPAVCERCNNVWMICVPSLRC